MIFVHELGHFLAAKLFRIRVERFSIGYPPRLIGKKVGDTDYCISAIPFGGYVKIAGMVDESLDRQALSEAPKPWEYRAKPWIQKAAVILAGPSMNIVFAFIVFSLITLSYGVPEQVPGTTVGRVLPGTPAEEAGLIAGDMIVSVGDEPVETWEDMTTIIHRAPGKLLTVTWMRNDSLYQASITPRREKYDPMGDDREVGRIGVGPVFEIQPIALGTALLIGGETVIDFTGMIFVSLKKLILREESIRSLGGPVFIAQLAGETARSGFGAFVGFMAFLSLNLGILNLLPIPVLDGGHMVFLGVEGIIRRPIPLKLKLAIQQVGMVLILGLMLFVVYNDILRIFQK
jgi:regulator of sigma E protease